MKASICTRYGQPEVLELQDIPKPQPNEKEVLVKVYASSVTAADTMMRQGVPRFARLFLGLRKPKHPVTGTGFSGIVEQVGSSVKGFKPGDRVFGEIALGAGTNTEYVCLAENALIVPIPDNMTFEQAAPLCDGVLTSTNFLRKVSRVEKGSRVLINGASGSLGTAAVQISRFFGAKVTGVCSARNADLVKSLGADEVIDYANDDFTQRGERYDIVYDTVGKLSYVQCKGVLAPSGQFISPVLSLNLLYHALRTSIAGEERAKFSATGLLPTPELTELLNELRPMLETGALTVVIDKTYSLAQIVDAHRYVDTGRKVGNIVINMA